MILAAHQPHYLPSPRLIDKIDRADVFVLQDDLQFVKQEWQNRNRIRTSDSWRWLTIPVIYTSRSLINQVTPACTDWVDRHERVVLHEYQGSVWLDRYQAIANAARSVADKDLATICEVTMNELLVQVGIRSTGHRQSELELPDTASLTREGRLIELCKRLECDTYLSGDGGHAYLDVSVFRKAGIDVIWQNYALQPYEQCHAGWIDNLSSLDLLLCQMGPVDHIRESRRNDNSVVCEQTSC